MLDTVFVVACYVDYHVTSMESELDGCVSREFMDVTGKPLMSNTRTKLPLRLYLGATPEHLVNGMYSFFPAMLGKGSAGFPRPSISIPCEYSDYFDEDNWRAPKGQGFALRDLGEDELRELWECLRCQVRSAGLLLGTRAEFPPRQKRRRRRHRQPR